MLKAVPPGAMSKPGKKSLPVLWQCHDPDHKFTQGEAEIVAAQLGIDLEQYPDFVDGMNDEMEHHDLTCGSILSSAIITLKHFEHDKDYYKKLKGCGLL